MPNIKPFRQYSEHNVLNGFFSVSGATLPFAKGTMVKITGSGWNAELSDPLQLGDVGNHFDGTVSQRFGVQAFVGPANSGDFPIGMTLNDVREFDENGEKLVFNPGKAARMQAVISGQAVPILTKGIVYYSGISTPVTGGDRAYIEDNGAILNYIKITGVSPVPMQIGRFLGPKDSAGYALLKLDL